MDRFDGIAVAGILLIGWGCYLVAPPVGLVVVGIILFGLGIFGGGDK